MQKIPENLEGTEDILVYCIKNLEETAKVIDILKKQPVIISLKSLKKSNVQRAVDIILGGAYATGKKLCKLDSLNILIT